MNIFFRYRIWSFLALLLPLPLNADFLDHWHWRNPLPQGNSLYGIVYANGAFTAVGALGTILTSSDAVNWVSQNAFGLDWGFRIAYGNGVLVIVTESGTIVTSTD